MFLHRFWTTASSKDKQWVQIHNKTNSFISKAAIIASWLVSFIYLSKQFSYLALVPLSQGVQEEHPVKMGVQDVPNEVEEKGTWTTGQWVLNAIQIHIYYGQISII